MFTKVMLAHLPSRGVHCLISVACRVIALAHRQLPGDSTAAALRSMARADAERDLQLAGFAVLQVRAVLDLAWQLDSASQQQMMCCHMMHPEHAVNVWGGSYSDQVLSHLPFPVELRPAVQPCSAKLTHKALHTSAAQCAGQSY